MQQIALCRDQVHIPFCHFTQKLCLGDLCIDSKWSDDPLAA